MVFADGGKGQPYIIVAFPDFLRYLQPGGGAGARIARLSIKVDIQQNKLEKTRLKILKESLAGFICKNTAGNAAFPDHTPQKRRVRGHILADGNIQYIHGFSPFLLLFLF